MEKTLTQNNIPPKSTYSGIMTIIYVCGFEGASGSRH